MATALEWGAFPHAYDYLKKFSYSRQELEALRGWTNRLKDETTWRVGEVPSDDSVTNDRHALACLDNQDATIPEALYWEVTFSSDSPAEELGLVGIGIDSDKQRVLYRNDGKITDRGSTGSFEAFDLGDTVGCGIVDRGCQVFFTKNGRRIGSVVSESKGMRLEQIRPCLTVKERTMARQPPTAMTNFGDTAFKFNIEAFCASVIRAGELAKELPTELFQRIIWHCFHSGAGPLTVSNPAEFKAVYRISTVCRYSHELWGSIIYETVRLAFYWEMSVATRLGLLQRIERLVTEEDQKRPWFHILFTRSQPRPQPRSALIHSWTCDYKNSSLRLPPHVPADLHIFIRTSQWDSLSTLELCNRTFRSWAQFAKLVFSPPCLEHLIVKNVGWTDLAGVPVPWVRFSRRLRTLRCSDESETSRMVDYLLLLFAGRRAVGSSCGPVLIAGDIFGLAQILKALIFECAPLINRAELESCSDGSYRLIGLHDLDTVHLIEVTLAPGGDGYHRVSNVWISKAYPHVHSKIQSLFLLLSNPQIPTQEIGTLKEPVEVQWTAAALAQVATFSPELCGGDPRGWHEYHVRDHMRVVAPRATRAQIQRTTHSGGQDPK